MNRQSEALQALLYARSIVYDALAKAFAQEPSTELVALFSSEDFGDICSLIDDAQGTVSKRLASVSAAAQHLAADGCLQEHNHWFIGQQLDVSPYESVHVSGENLVFQACTLEVRKAYQAQGFKASGYPHFPDDHIATELDFLAKLAQRAFDAFKREDYDSCMQVLVASHEFILEHPMEWIDSFALSFGSTGKGFYENLALFTKQFLEMDSALLHELKASSALSVK